MQHRQRGMTFLGILVLVVVGLHVVRRVIALYRERALQRTRVAVKQELP